MKRLKNFVGDIEKMFMLNVIVMGVLVILSFLYTLVSLVIHLFTKNQVFLDATGFGLAVCMMSFIALLVVIRVAENKG
ncbi:hypothetical protein [Paenibacillus amylolyticus]|uniref:Uncharacterized protein n=1 Tax=Paenibacillus amylolyticus TaxID=1451 RepID=A0ABD8B2Y8_PAEAM